MPAFLLEVKLLISSVNEGFTAPRGTPATFILVLKTKSDPNGTRPLHLALSTARKRDPMSGEYYLTSPIAFSFFDNSRRSLDRSAFLMM